jgi:bifunctional DNA-binding transcriptional regulator/antitoxin component of YhaV-PrlF toxin-antitoxin module
MLLGYPKNVPVEFEVSLVQVGHSLRVTIPVEVVRALKLKKGEKLGLSLTDHEIVLRRIPP